MKPRRGILVIQSMGLGDIFFAMPVLKVLKRCFPDEPIYFFTHENHATLFKYIPEASGVITYSKKSILSFCGIVSKIKSFHFRACFVLNPVFKGALAAWMAGIPERTGYRRDFERKQSCFGLEKILLTRAFSPAETKKHEIDRYLDLVRFCGLLVREEDKIPGFRISGETKTAPAEKAKPLRIVFNLGAAWEMRKWPAERVVRAAKALVRILDAEILLTGGKEDKETAGRIAGEIGMNCKNTAGEILLDQMPLFLQDADLVITNDTGIMHMAAALNRPIVALFGPGDPAKVRPCSENSRVLLHPMPCHPCKFQYTRRCKSNLCMKEIEVREVVEAACHLLGRPLNEKIPYSIDDQKSTAHKTKVLYLQSTSEIGGTDMSLWRTLEMLDLERFEPHVVLPKSGPLVESYKKAGARVHFLPGMRKLTRRKGIFYFLVYLAGYIPACWRIRNLIRKEKIDIVHTNTLHNLYGFLAAWFACVPHVWHVREIVKQSRIFGALEGFLASRFTTKTLVMSNAISRLFLSSSHGFPKCITKLYDGVDLKKFHPGISGERIRKDLQLGPEALLIGTVTRLDPWKGIELFLEAAARVSREIPAAHFLICGGEIEGHQGYEEKLKQKARELGLSLVHFTGWKYKGPDIPEVYGALDISVQCPVYPEPFGLAAVEAMASGVPVIAPNEGGPAELCAHDETAILIPPRDVYSLAAAMTGLLKNPEKRKLMGLSGRLRAEKYFDAKKCTRKLEALYEEMLKEGKK